MHDKSSSDSTLNTIGTPEILSPVNCDISVHVDDKTVRLCALGFSSVANNSLHLNSCVFVGTISTSNDISAIDVVADRYDCGRKISDKVPFPRSSVRLSPDDISIPCFLNRRISKTDLKELSLANLFPSIEEHGFTPSLRDIFSCCVSLRLSMEDKNSFNPSAVVSRADLRVSVPTNTTTYIPVTLPANLFGGISVKDLLPPVISSASKQSFRAGYLSLRSPSNRMASSIGFLLDTDIWKKGLPTDQPLLGIWISGTDLNPRNNFKIYAACLRYAFDPQLTKSRVLPSISTGHRVQQGLPFTSLQNGPYFLLAIVNCEARKRDVKFYECRISPALNPSFTILTATSVLPPPQRNTLQNLNLNFALGRASSVALQDMARDSFNDSTDFYLEDDKDNDVNLTARKKPIPQPIPMSAAPSVPDVSLWMPKSSRQFPISLKSNDTNTFADTPLQTPKDTPRTNTTGSGVLAASFTKTTVESMSDFEEEWRRIRQRAEYANKPDGGPKMSSTLISQSAFLLTSPPVDLSDGNRNDQSSQSHSSVRTLRDACVGVGNSLMMLSSPQPPRQKVAPESSIPITESSVCSQCGHGDEASVVSKSDFNNQGCCFFPTKHNRGKHRKLVNENDKNWGKFDEIPKKGVDDQPDPCSLILKWLNRCNNETSQCSEPNPVSEAHSRCSSSENIKTAAAICQYLNGDSTIRKQHESETESDDNQFVSLSASSHSMILKQDKKEKSKKASVMRCFDFNSSFSKTNRSVDSKRADENSDFAARAREIVRQMDEWGLAPTNKPGHNLSKKSSFEETVDYEHQRLVRSPVTLSNEDVSVSTSSSGSVYGKRISTIRTSADVSVLLPRVVALESLRLGPTDTTLLMNSLASKHLAKGNKEK